MQLDVLFFGMGKAGGNYAKGKFCCFFTRPH